MLVKVVSLLCSSRGWMVAVGFKHGVGNGSWVVFRLLDEVHCVLRSPAGDM